MGRTHIKNDVEKCKHELISYVSDNANDYKEIFGQYDKKNCDKLRKDFDGFYSSLKKCKDLSDDKIVDSIKKQSDIFYLIGKSKRLSKHQKVCVLSMNVYLSYLCNCLCKKGGNVREACGYESTSSKTSESCSDKHHHYSEKSVRVIETSSSSSSSKTTDCSSNELKLNKKPKKDCKPYGNKDSDSSSHNKSNHSSACPPVNCACTDESYPIKDADECCKEGGCYDVCGLGDCNDIEQLKKVTIRLKVVLKQICMLMAIFCQMQQQYVEKMNYLTVCDCECYVDCVSIDSQNKLTYLLYKQVNSLITQGNCIFNGTKDTQPIKVYLNCGKSLTICMIDNIKFTFVQDCKCSYIVVNVGSRQYKLWFLKDCITNAEAICILKENCTTVKLILHALTSNKKMIEHWLNIACNMSKCKEICNIDCDNENFFPQPKSYGNSCNLGW